MNTPRPYLSIVLAVRNDNYGGDFNHRLQNCINWFTHYANRYNLTSEFVLVNYNPVPNQQQLHELISFPASTCVSFRIITIPPAFHESISDETIRKKLPMYEYLAKNMGIRRAKGEYILAANPDILIDPSIIRFIAKRKLQPGTYYRANRADYRLPSTTVQPATDLARIRQAVFRVFMKGYRHTVNGLTLPQQFLIYFKNKLKLAYNLELVKHEDLANKYTIPITYDNISLKVHANCSGDFMLMHRQSWYALKGYPENTYLAIHTDALMVAMAFFSGLKEQVFFQPVYHQDHERRFVADNTNPHIHAMFRRFEDEGRQMEKQKAPIIYNTDNWGYPNQQFEENE